MTPVKTIEAKSSIWKRLAMGIEAMEKTEAEVLAEQVAALRREVADLRRFVEAGADMK